MPKQPEPLPVIVETLTASETKRLAELEKIVSQGLPRFLEVGRALLEIRDSKLYRATHRSFSEYYRDKWELEESQIYRLLNAAVVADNLLPVGEVPTSERSIRALVRLDTPSQQREAWKKALKAAPKGKVTGPVVEAVVEEIIQKEAKKDTKPAPPKPPSKKTLLRCLSHIESMTSKQTRAVIERQLDPWELSHLARLSDSKLKEAGRLVAAGYGFAAALEDINRRLDPGSKIEEIHTLTVRNHGKWSGPCGLFYHVCVSQKAKDDLESRIPGWPFGGK